MNMGTNQAGGYSEARALDQHDKDIFAKAMDGLVGVEYTPEQVATQVVAGTNYRFFCKYKTITAQPEMGIAIITVFEELPVYGGDVVVTDITRYHN